MLSSVILQETSSIDVDSASIYFESLENYLKSLLLFTQTHKATDKKIIKAIEKQDGNAFRLCHTLKGVSRLIGAKKLETCCEQLEFKISEKADLKNHLLLTQLESELALLLDDIDKILNKAKSPDTNVQQLTSLTQDIDVEQLTHLHFLISQYDTQAINLTEKLIAENKGNTEFVSQLTSMLSYLNQFNYEQAGKILESFTSISATS